MISIVRTIQREGRVVEFTTVNRSLVIDPS